jgi:large subunit ribosomal protein L24
MAKAKFKIKTGDEVIVTTGKDKGKKGKVTKILTAEARAIVSGINIATKHQKPSAAGAGGIVKKELSIHISNIALLDPKDGKATRVGYKIEGDKKVRVAKKSGEAIA